MKSNNIILKTGVSVFFCILISKLLHLKYPFFVALPSFVPISNSVAESLKAGRNRLLGTLIGALVGIIFAFIQPGNSILCGLGISIIIYLCNYIRWGSSSSIAGLVFISIMVSIKDDNPILYSIDRISNTLIGIIVTLIVNNLIFHTNYVREFDATCKYIKAGILDFIREKIINDKSMQFDKLDKEIEKFKIEVESYFEEYSFRKTTNHKLEQFRDMANTLICISLHLKILNSIDHDFCPNKQNNETFKKTFNMNYNCENYLNNETNTIFNYHLEKIFDKLSIIDDILDVHTK